MKRLASFQMYFILFFALFTFFVKAQQPKVYDYIVVGSGPGGGPLAANLARAGHTVLLLEAGDDQGDNVNTTNTYNSNAATNDEKTRWDFFVAHSDDAEREKKYLRTTWRTANGTFYVGLDPPANATRLGVWYPRAGTLGGCAMHNAAVNAIPANADWQYIADLTGDTSWTPQNMRKYLVKLEHCNYVANGSSPDHGYTGWLETSMQDSSWTAQAGDGRTLAGMVADASGVGNSSTSSLASLVKRDMNNNDLNRDTQVGLFGPLSHDKGGKRSSPNVYIRATLKDAAGYPLSVNLNSLVTRILFDTSNPEKPVATGVEFIQGRSLYKADPRYDPKRVGTPGTALASKEVIISGGAFNTPQILKLSGLGPAAELAKFKIPLIKDLPGVGMNMQDNYEGGILGTYAKGIQGGFFYMMYKTQLAKLRDIFFFCGSFSFEGFWPGFPAYYPRQFECAFAHMAPKDIAGRVTLTSSNPQDVPDINLGFFAKGADEDLNAMLDAVKFMRKIFTALPNNTFTDMHPCTYDGCSDDEIKEYLRSQVYSHHVTGSARIGAEGDKMAVLDSKFRVRGVGRLRVVDGSVFPVQPGAFPVMPTFMVSEKATEVILEAAKGL